MTKKFGMLVTAGIFAALTFVVVSDAQAGCGKKNTQVRSYEKNTQPRNLNKKIPLKKDNNKWNSSEIKFEKVPEIYN